MTINFTKFLAFLALVLAALLSAYLEEASIFIATVPSVAIILGVRDYSDSKKKAHV